MAALTTARPHCLADIGSGDGNTNTIVSEPLEGNDRQGGQDGSRERPLNLLDLPVDILRLIVKEITHTNDLTALALTNSALHNLAIPLIYSRFDIVWPDGNITATESKSVDALTYGLSTLCLGSAFARATRRTAYPISRTVGKFAGNEYAKYTKKFSLGNGPKDWVEEYMITKESGKMLGTLVALAIAKMTNLEAFVWDMPTGVLSDIFMALGSLGEAEDDGCKLSRMWIRWHDNSDQLVATSPVHPSMIGAPAIVPPGSHVTPVGIMLPSDARHPPPRPPVSYSAYHCEYPTFSVLPPLKSLTVLDIDELSYLDEMAVLIERSKNSLRELRVGIAVKAANKDFVQPWDGSGLRQIDHRARWPGESVIGERRLGGVLGVLVGKIYDIRKGTVATLAPKRALAEIPVGSSPTPSLATSPSPETPVETEPASQTEVVASVKETQNGAGQTVDDLDIAPRALGKGHTPIKAEKSGRPRNSRRIRLDGKLKLETLELERVPLSMQVCRSAFDWSALTSLTILDCAQHDTLWKVLRKSCQPTPIGTGTNGSTRIPSPAALQYQLSLKHIHTDSTTPSLIAFIKETLAPNTLETLFLQDRKRGSSPPAVQLDAIFKGALKRHRTSIQKLLLDSSAKPSTHPPPVGENNNRWKNWVLNTEVLTYITSGRMPNLKELAVSLDYKDWHTFLQRLPNIPHLHSINIPNIADYVHPNFEPRELAYQMTDIITLRPEIRLCYIGIGAKCFEILESRDTGSRKKGDWNGGLADDATASAEALEASFDDDIAELVQDAVEDDSATEEDDDEDESDDDNTPTSATDPDDSHTEDEEDGSDKDGEEEEDSDDDDDDFVESNKGGVKLRLREILFYDDKVAVFKARHGRL
ncbi:hypothetical protein V8F06_003004 [Rhypophila decipiens]